MIEKKHRKMLESLAVILDPYKELIASSTALVTYGQQLSGVFICNDIRKKSSTRGLSAMPFIAGFVMWVCFVV